MQNIDNNCTYFIGWFQGVTVIIDITLNRPLVTSSWPSEPMLLAMMLCSVQVRGEKEDLV